MFVILTGLSRMQLLRKIEPSRHRNGAGRLVNFANKINKIWASQCKFGCSTSDTLWGMNHRAMPGGIVTAIMAMKIKTGMYSSYIMTNFNGSYTWIITYGKGNWKVLWIGKFELIIQWLFKEIPVGNRAQSACSNMWNTLWAPCYFYCELLMK